MVTCNPCSSACFLMPFMKLSPITFILGIASLASSSWRVAKAAAWAEAENQKLPVAKTWHRRGGVPTKL